MRLFGFTKAQSRLLVSTGALMAVLVSVSPSYASPVVQVVNGGLRTASVADLTLGQVTTTHSNQPSTGTMELTADDASGTGAGWNVTILSSDFVYTGSNDGTDIPAANFAITLANSPELVIGLAIDVTNGPKVPTSGATGSLDSARKVLQANADFGLGQYTQDLDVSLLIPANSRAGTYTGTITTTITSAP